MLTINFNLKHKRGGYECSITGEDEGNIIFEEKFEDIKTENVYVKRAKTIGLGGKNLGVALHMYKTPSKKELIKARNEKEVKKAKKK